MPYLTTIATELLLIPVHASAEQFFQCLNNDLPAVQHEYDKRIYRTHGGIVPQALTFTNQFKPLSLSEDEFTSRLPRHPHNFYAGYEPTWQDILNDRDAPLDITDRLLERIRKVDPDHPKQEVYCITGRPFSGKSTAFLRAAKRLLNLGREVYVFRGETRLDVEATLWWLRTYPDTILAFDGLADPAPEVGLLLRRAANEGVPIQILAAERDGRTRRLYSTIPAEALDVNGLRPEPLSDRDIQAILEKLREAVRLGQLTNKSRQEQFQYFVSHGRQLFGSLSELERGSGFRERVERDYELIEVDAHRVLYVMACMASAIGNYRLPLAIAAEAAEVDISELVELLATECPLSDALQLDSDGRAIKPRHRRLASMLIDEVLAKHHRNRVYTCSLSLAKALAPYVTTLTITQKTIPYRIARELMDEDVITRWVSLERVGEWYEALKDDYGWNARYWEQRALSELRQGHWDTAESYAEHSMKVHRDPFTLNTTGMILMRKAALWFQPGSDDAWNYYWRGVQRLRASRTEAREQDRHYEHPFMTFFSYTIDFVKRHRPQDVAALDSDRGRFAREQWDRLSHEWNRWYTAAMHEPEFAHQELLQRLADYQHTWLLEATVSD